MLFSRGEWKRAAAERKQAAERVKGWCRRFFDLGDDDAVAANEVACPDPGCPDVETIILVMRAGEATRAFKVAKPIAAVTEGDIRDLLARPPPP